MQPVSGHQQSANSVQQSGNSVQANNQPNLHQNMQQKDENNPRLEMVEKNLPFGSTWFKTLIKRFSIRISGF